jgi:predicted nucleic acid-binding protein
VLVADSSVLYALFDATDGHHAVARAEAARRRPFVVPSEILTETLGLVNWRLGRDAARAALAALLAMPHARIVSSRQSVVDEALRAASTLGPLTYQDWILVHACKSSGARPWTYDRDVLRACR